jgi:3-mercaptopyruvate sulfurtransferase SseA
MLAQAGVKDARALLGGYGAWLTAKYPLARDDQPR